MPRLSILVPVYNEEATLLSVMRAIAGACPDAQTVYIDDGSTDGSRDVLRAEKRPQDVVLEEPHAGKGAAIRAGLAKADGLFCVIQDADLEYDPAQIPALLQEAETHKGSAVFGSRFLRPNPNIYKRFLVGNTVITGAINLLFGGRLTDSYTCYKLLPTGLFRQLPLAANGFELEAEIACHCLKRRIPIREVAVRYRPRTIAEGKKIGWKDAWTGLMTALRIRCA